MIKKGLFLVLRIAIVAFLWLLTILIGFGLLNLLFTYNWLTNNLPSGLYLLPILAATMFILSGTLLIVFMHVSSRVLHKVSGKPIKVALLTLLLATAPNALIAIYVKLASCTDGREGWHCYYEAKSYAVLSFLAFLIASAVAVVVLVSQKKRLK